MRLTLAQLQIFREIMESGSMSTAARNLNKTQPAVSLTLKGLETAIGFPLFARENRKLVPVPEAHYLLAEAEAVLKQMQRVQRNMERLSLGEEGTLQIAVMPGLATALVPAFLADYTADKPNVTLSLYTRSSAQLQELVGSQSVDMGTGDFDEAASRSVRIRSIKVSGLCFVAVPVNSPLAQLKSITPLQLSDYTIAGMQPDHPFSESLMGCFSHLTKAPAVRHLSQTMLPLLQFVARNQCAAVVDPLTVATVQSLKFMPNEVVFKPFKSSLRYEYAIVSPSFRPSSILATNVREAWLEHMVSLIDGLSANAVVEYMDDSGTHTVSDLAKSNAKSNANANANA